MSSKAIDPEVENQLLANYLYYVGAVGAALVITFKVYVGLLRYLRTVSSLGNSTQYYFSQESWKFAFFKRSIQYAPLFHKRHNREFALSSAVNMGTLPTRLQFVILLGYFATNVAFCLTGIQLHENFTTISDQLRNRTGVLSVVNMVPMVLCAGRNNPLIRWLDTSFDTFNLLHRWLGRIVALEAIAHTLAHWIGKTSEGKAFAAVIESTVSTQFLLFGFVGTLGLVFLNIQAVSVLRHAWYETFKILHILGAITTVVGVWYHCQLKGMSQLNYLYAVVALWGFDRAARFIRLAYGNIGAGGTQTLVEALPGNACRVTVTMARPWAFEPGQHAYLYFPSISGTQSHPFSVSWSDEAEMLDGEKVSMARSDILGARKTSINFIIRARAGVTGTLYKKAAACPDGRMTTSCFVEGPYGGYNLNSYGTVMLFAGGVGITQAVPHVRDLVIGYANGTVAARKIVLVWIIQTPEHLEWIRPWMTEILAMDRRRECLRIMLFVSRPRSTKEIHSPSSTVQMFPGRPNIEHLIGAEMENQVGTLGVTVCGPGALSDEVRLAVRGRQYYGAVEFQEEAFSW
ncbi:unnamed protein product [Discula destructiva]